MIKNSKLFQLLFEKLSLVELGIKPSVLKKFVMAASFHELAIRYNQYQIGILDGRNTM
jgi:hypothetical protein